MASHSSTLAWKIPWMEEPGRLQSMGSLRVGHDWATSLSLFTFMHWRRKWQLTPVLLPGKSHGQRSLVGCCLGATQSRTRLKRLSSSSSSSRDFLSSFTEARQASRNHLNALTHRHNKTESQVSPWSGLLHTSGFPAFVADTWGTGTQTSRLW